MVTAWSEGSGDSPGKDLGGLAIVRTLVYPSVRGSHCGGVVQLVDGGL